ncbi:hypothetical protein X801_10222, partial [Opisthorchis viverrini]
MLSWSTTPTSLRKHMRRTTDYSSDEPDSSQLSQRSDIHRPDREGRVYTKIDSLNAQKNIVNALIVDFDDLSDAPNGPYAQ